MEIKEIETKKEKCDKHDERENNNGKESEKQQGKNV